MKYLKHTIIITILAAGTVFASHVAWQGTEWIANGQLISASKTKDNFEYLYERVQELENHVHETVSSIPSCSVGQILVSSGVNTWQCDDKPTDGINGNSGMTCRILTTETGYRCQPELTEVCTQGGVEVSRRVVQQLGECEGPGGDSGN